MIGFMHYLRSGSDSLRFRAILRIHEQVRFWDIWEFVFSAVKPLINCQIFSTIIILFFHGTFFLFMWVNEHENFRAYWRIFSLFGLERAAKCPTPEGFCQISQKRFGRSSPNFLTFDNYIGHLLKLKAWGQVIHCCNGNHLMRVLC